MMRPDGTRASLFIKLKSNDSAVRELAWDEFDYRYRPIITRFAQRQGVSHVAAEDVVQEVLLGFFATSARFVYDPSKGRFRSYLKTCVCRLIGAERRREYQRVPAGELLEAATADVDRVWDDLWEERVMELAVASLERAESPQSCDIFRQCVLDGAAPQRVAETLGLSIDAVYKSRQRTIASFKNILTQLAADELYC
jgi:RNA polymerase sigma factor (sigma-70 family)